MITVIDWSILPGNCIRGMTIDNIQVLTTPVNIKILENGDIIATNYRLVEYHLPVQCKHNEVNDVHKS